MNWKGSQALVTGGASFIGSHLVDELVKRGARIRVAEDFSSGKRENLEGHLKSGNVELLEGDLRDQIFVQKASRGIHVIFHLAAAHGGRGYVDLHQAACAENLMLDGLVFQAARKAGVDKIVYASSGCVAPETLVETDVGLEDIHSLFNRANREDEVSVYTERGPNNISHILALGLHPQIRIKTRHGYSLTGGKDHRVLALTETGKIQWTSLSLLKAGTFILLKSQTARGDNCIPLWTPNSLKKERGQPRKILRIPDKISTELAEILGYFIGDGSLNELRGHVVFVDKDKNTLLYIQRSLEKEFGVMGNVKEKKTRSGRGTKMLVVCSTSLMEYFRFLLGGSFKAHLRRTPSCLFRADEKTRAAFLRGFFEAEGYVNISSGTIAATTASSVLARQIQILLLSVGVFSNIVERKRFSGYSVGNPQYEVVLTYPESYRQFVEKVGFLSKAKRGLLLEALGKRGAGSLRIPFLGKDLIKHLPWRGPRGSSTIHARWYSRNRAAAIPRIRMKEYLADRVVSHSEIGKWRFLCDESIYFDMVTSVEETFGEVYDLTVPGPNSYVSNGFISHNCVYPNHLQTDPKQMLYLTEEMVAPPYDADNMYGWAKLMGEMTLKTLCKDYGIKSASCRYFTVYGPRGHENHAVIAMIARAFVKQNPFEVWGDGYQIRNWTWVGDIVEGTILAAEKIDDGTAVNLGTMERIQVIDAVKMVLDYTGHKPEIRFRTDMPTGPLNRVADNSLAKKLLGWTPQVSFREGLQKTIDWYFSSKKLEQVRGPLDRLLTERGLHS